MTVTFDDVLGSLCASTEVPSDLGPKLDHAQRLKLPRAAALEIARRDRLERLTDPQGKAWIERLWNTTPVHDDAQAAFRDSEARIDAGIMRRAQVMRCIGDLERRRIIRFAVCPDVVRFAKATGAGQGAVVIGCLRAFERRRTQSTEAALAEVYMWMQARDRELTSETAEGVTTAQAFREEKTALTKTHRRKAMQLVADSTIVLSAWVEEWNKREVSGAVDASN